MDAELIDEALQKVKENVGSITTSRKQLIHGDLGSYNMIAVQERITGIIDWSLAMYGDHLYDIANFMFWNEDKLRPLIAELRANYLDTAENKRAVTIYMIRIGLEELHNTVILGEPGYDVVWVANRLQDTVKVAELC